MHSRVVYNAPETKPAPIRSSSVLMAPDIQHSVSHPPSGNISQSNQDSSTTETTAEPVVEIGAAPHRRRSSIIMSVPIIDNSEITFRKRSGSVLMQSHIPTITIDNKEYGGTSTGSAMTSVASSEPGESSVRRRRSTMGGALLEAAVATTNIVSFSSNPQETINQDTESTIQSGSNVPFRRTSIVDGGTALPSSTSVPFRSAFKAKNNVSENIALMGPHVMNTIRRIRCCRTRRGSGVIVWSSSSSPHPSASIIYSLI